MNIRLLQPQWCMTLWVPSVAGSMEWTEKLWILQVLFFISNPSNALKIKSLSCISSAKETPAEKFLTLLMPFLVIWSFFFLSHQNTRTLSVFFFQGILRFWIRWTRMPDILCFILRILQITSEIREAGKGMTAFLLSPTKGKFLWLCLYRAALIMLAGKATSCPVPRRPCWWCLGFITKRKALKFLIPLRC